MMQKSPSTSQKGISICDICQQAASKLAPFSEYGAEQKLICHDCLEVDERVSLCCSCGEYIVAYNGQPCKDTIDAQQEGILQWLCPNCKGISRDVICLCGKTTITSTASTGGKVLVQNPVLLNGQIYLCDNCKDFEPLESCSICKQNVVALDGGSEYPIVVNMSRLYGFSNIVACRSCWSCTKKCGACDAPATDAQGTCLDGAVGHKTTGSTIDYRCKFCNSMTPLKKEQEARRLYLDICKWFDTDTYGLGFKLKYPQLKIWDSYQLSTDAGNSLEPGKHICGVYNSKTQDVCVEWNLPRVIFLASVAHELAHAWQDQKGVLSKQTNKLLTEGFAEWVAYVYLEGMLASFTDSEEARAARFYMEKWMAENPDPIYGNGLRAFLKIGGFSKRANIMQMALAIK